MAIKIKIETGNSGLKDKVEQMSGIDLDSCLQCMKCSSGCPVVCFADSSPSDIIRRLQLGAGDEILSRSIIWLCASCETCHTRCPMGIDMAAVMDSLRSLSVMKNARRPKGRAPLFNKIMLMTVKIFGRSYDIGTMALFKTGSGSFTRDMDKLPAIFRKGKIAILPSTGGDRKTVRRIFRKTRKA